jgi:hypothetical protein
LIEQSFTPHEFRHDCAGARISEPDLVSELNAYRRLTQSLCSHYVLFPQKKIGEFGDMSSRFFVIPVSRDGSLPNDLKICETKGAALEAAMKGLDRHAGLVIAEERKPYEELELVRIVGHVDAQVLTSLVA